MDETRHLVTAALEERQRCGQKIRQPLNTMYASNGFSWTKLNENFLSLVKNKINVKNIIFSSLSQDKLIEFDLTITQELKEEGILRDLIREIQSARKTAGLKPREMMPVKISAPPQETLDIIKKYEVEIKKETSANSIEILPGDKFKVYYDIFKK